MAMGVSFNFHFSKMESAYKKRIRSAYVMGVAQHHAYLSLNSDKTAKLEN